MAFVTTERLNDEQRALIAQVFGRMVANGYGGRVASTQFRLWAERGHRVYGVDVNKPLIRLAEKRAAE